MHQEGPILLTWINLNLSVDNDPMFSKVWVGMTCPFSSLSECTFEVWGWVSNFISHLIIGLIIYLCWDQSWTMLIKGALVHKAQYALKPSNINPLVRQLPHNAGWVVRRFPPHAWISVACECHILWQGPDLLVIFMDFWLGFSCIIVVLCWCICPH